VPAAQGNQHLYKLIGAVVFLVVLGVVGLLAAPAVIDWNAYRDALEDTLSEATGLDVDIAGDLDITFLPSPRVNARDVSWPAGEGRRPAVQIPEVQAFVALSDLIAGELRITDIALAGPRAVLVLDEQDRPEWFAGGGVEDDRASPTFTLDRIAVRDGILSVARRGQPDSAFVIDGIGGVVTTSQTTGRISVKGDGLVGGRSLAYSASVGRARPDRPMPLRLSFELAETGLSASFNGHVEGAMPDAVAVGRIELEADRLAALSGEAGLPSMPEVDGAAKLVALARVSPAQVTLSELSFSTEGARAKGKAMVGFGRRPTADIDIAFSRVNVDRFAAGERFDVAGDLASFLGALADADPSLLSEDLALRLRLRADAMQVGGSVVHDANLAAEVSEGTLFLEQAAILLPGGSDLALDGVLEPREGSLAFEGGLAVTSDNLRALMEWAGLDTGRVPPARLRALELGGTLRSGPDSLSLDDLTALVDATQANGRVAVGLGDEPRFDIDLAIDTFSLDAYRLQERRRPKVPSPDVERPDPLGFLASAAGDIRLRFDRLTVLGQPLERVLLGARISDRAMDVHEIEVADFVGIAVDGSMTVSLRDGRPQIGLDVVSQTRDPERLLRHLGLYPTAASRRLTGSTLEVRGEGDLELVTFSAEAAVAGGSIVIDGGVADPLGPAQVTAEIQASHPTPVRLVGALGLPGITAADTEALGDGGMLRMAARARAAGDDVAVDIDSLTIGETDIAGQANLSLASDRPALDLVVVGTEVSGAGVLAVLSSVQRATDVSLDLQAERLTMGAVRIEDASARAEMTALGATIGPVRGGALGGTVDLSLSIGLEAGQDLIEGQIAAQGLDPGGLLQVLGGPAALNGALDLQSSFTARGRTVAEYLASLSGRAALSGEVRIVPAESGSGRFAAGLLGDNLPPIQQVAELSSVLETAFGRQPVPLEAEISVSQGIARTETMLVSGAGARAVSYGTWDIPGQRLETTIDVVRGGAAETPYFTLGLVGPPRTPNVRVAGAWLQRR